MTCPVGLPPTALPVTTALSLLLSPSTMVEEVGVVTVDGVMVVTSKHSSELVSALAL